MKGLVFLGDGVVEYTEELELIEPGPREVVVRMVAAGVCHSDVSVMNGTIPWKPPSVLGHEGAGVVEEVGAEVRSVRVGDHVVVSTLANCGVCPKCQTGHPTQCRKSIGVIKQPFLYKGEPASNFAATSSFAERTIVSEVQAVPISKDIPLTSACLIACGVLTGVGAVLNRARPAPGQTAAVFGTGGVGLNVIQGLKLAQAGRIIAVDTNPAKEALARQFGATDFINAADTDAVAAIRELFPFHPKMVVGPLGAGGVDFAFECIGNTKVLRQCIDSIDWGGYAVAVGTPGPTDEFSSTVGALAQVDRGIIGCRYGSSCPQHDVRLYADWYTQGKLLLDELVTETYPLEKFHTVVEDMEAGRLARGVLEF
ncbi:MAG TPA: Zn-dependent alcohol dehydrogenase [Acidimicrobiales bacterium]|jgi:S-(hydroxymethyl)glutathione dehydrogenase/alcohol dehydrogenase|nr:Zn-dependent alcohol dehydrogenase [Acidimicrobiales bacterium]